MYSISILTDIFGTSILADVNECLNPITCIEPATCENTVGSYKCKCPSGYIKKPGAYNQCQGMMCHLKIYLG